MNDLLLAGGVVVNESGTTRADVAIRDGKISALLPPNTPVPARSVLDVRGRFLLPGLIDSHVHFRQPGLDHKEDWAHGSRAAVAGGVTTVIDMPNTLPPTNTPERAWSKHRLIAGTSLVDYRFHAGVDPADPSAIRKFTEREARSVKVFLSGHHTAPDVVRDPAALDEIVRVAADQRWVVICHAECDAVFGLIDAWRDPPRTVEDYEPSRPRSAGIVAVMRLIELARRHDARIHVLHVSSREEADLLTAANAAGVPVTFEVTGHHLTFTVADLGRLGSRIRLRPAIRDAADRDRLWEAVLRGHAATIGSDHAPHTAAEKGRPPADAPPGLPGVQELFLTVVTGLRERLPTAEYAALLPHAVRLLSAGPAGLFGIADRKGAIAPGMDADVVVFDPHRNAASQRVHAKCGWSAYESRAFTGGIDRTLRRGALAYQWTPEAEDFGEPSGIWL